MGISRIGFGSDLGCVGIGRLTLPVGLSYPVSSACTTLDDQSIGTIVGEEAAISLNAVVGQFLTTAGRGAKQAY